MIPGGIGYLELLLLFALILVLFGPDRLPGIARKLGHLTEQLRKAAALFQHNLLAMEEDLETADSPAENFETTAGPEEDTGAADSIEGATGASEPQAASSLPQAQDVFDEQETGTGPRG